MKPIVGAIVALIIFGAAGGAGALESEDVGFSLTVGQFGPTGDLADYYKSSLGVAAQGGYFVEDVLSINLGGAFASFPAKEGSGGANVVGFYLMPEFVQPVWDYFLPSVSLGAGFYQVSADLHHVDPTGGGGIKNTTQSATVFGLTGGLAIRFLLGEQFFMGLNGRYQLLFPSTVKVATGHADALGNPATKDFDLTSDFYHLGLEIGFAFGTGK